MILFWTNAYSSRSMKLFKVFVEEILENVKLRIVNRLFSVNGLIVIAISSFCITMVFSFLSVLNKRHSSRIIWKKLRGLRPLNLSKMLRWSVDYLLWNY